MPNFCHIKSNVIDIAPGLLPRSWRNVSGLDKATSVELKAMGWLPVVYVNEPRVGEAFDPATQIRTGPTGVSVGDAVPKGADKVTGSNPGGLAVKQHTYEPDVAIVVREGDAVDHSHVRKTLAASGYQLWVEEGDVLIKAMHDGCSSVNVEAWKWAEDD